MGVVAQRVSGSEKEEQAKEIPLQLQIEIRTEGHAGELVHVSDYGIEPANDHHHERKPVQPFPNPILESVDGVSYAQESLHDWAEEEKELALEGGNLGLFRRLVIAVFISIPLDAPR